MIPGCDPQGWQHYHHGAGEVPLPRCHPPREGTQRPCFWRPSCAKQLIFLAPSSLGVRWVTSLECCESGQTVPLINPDLILLAAGSSLRPCCLLKAAHSCQGYWGRKSRLSPHHEPGPVLSALMPISLNFHIAIITLLSCFSDGERDSLGLCMFSRPHNKCNGQL